MRCATTLLVALLLGASLTACGDDGATSGAGGGASTSSAGGGASTSSATTTGTSSSGTGGGATSGGGGGSTPGGSEGCGTTESDTPGAWSAAKTLQVGDATRTYFLRLPTGYDRDRPYPIIFQFHGCSPSREANNVPLDGDPDVQAILVRGAAVGDCWDTSSEGPDVAFFDAMRAAIEATTCVDVERRFASGYSSGAFMTHRLACQRGAELRGVATIAGGMGGSGCTGSVAALLIHDTGDGTVGIAASEQARDLHLSQNGCADTTTAMDPSPCVSYDGCDAGLPVVWCQTTGQGHGRQDALAAEAFLGFFEAL